MKVKYIGPCATPVDVLEFDLVAIAPGEPIDLPDDQAVRLCEQPDNWAPADKASAKFFGDFLVWVAAHHRALDPATGEWVTVANDPAPAVPAADVPEGAQP